MKLIFAVVYLATKAISKDVEGENVRYTIFKPMNLAVPLSRSRECMYWINLSVHVLNCGGCSDLGKCHVVTYETF